MQDMTSEACASQSTPAASVTNVPTKTLTDSRDGNTYTIAKLKDGKCWMTQNLRLVKSMVLTPEDSDVITSDYVLPSPVALDPTNDNPKYFSANDQYVSRVFYNNDTNYGAYYNWYTATAGTGTSSITNGTTNSNGGSSICPKGWRLPTGGNNIGEFYQLLNGFTQGNQLTTAPYRFTYGGSVVTSTLTNSSSNGLYWSATAASSTDTYVLFFNSSVNLPSYNSGRYAGFSVRCVAR